MKSITVKVVLKMNNNSRVYKNENVIIMKHNSK